MKIIDQFLSEDDFDWIYEEVNAHDRGWYPGEILSQSYIIHSLKHHGKLALNPLQNLQFCCF